MDNFDNDFNNYERQPNHEVNSRYGNTYRKYDGIDNDDTEFATDFFARGEDVHNATSGAVVAGIISVIASFIALFTYPIALGIAGIALGGFSIAKGNKSLGYLGIFIGVIAVATSIIFGGSMLSLF